MGTLKDPIDPVDQLINSNVPFVVRGRHPRCNMGRNRFHILMSLLSA